MGARVLSRNIKSPSLRSITYPARLASSTFRGRKPRSQFRVTLPHVRGEKNKTSSSKLLGSGTARVRAWYSGRRTRAQSAGGRVPVPRPCLSSKVSPPPFLWKGTYHLRRLNKSAMPRSLCDIVTSQKSKEHHGTSSYPCLAGVVICILQSDASTVGGVFSSFFLSRLGTGHSLSTRDCLATHQDHQRGKEGAGSK